MINTQGQLAEIIENPNVVLRERILYAKELAEIGDIRVPTFQPKMININSGSFKMGSNKNEIEVALEEYSHLFREFKIEEVKEWFCKEFPSHEVEVEEFNISKYLITNQNYKDFQINIGEKQVGNSFHPSISNHPVKNVTIKQAQEYCNWLSTKTNRNFRLPTEMEWEWVAMSCQHNFRYPWGNKFDINYTNTAESNINNTTAVGLFPEGYSVQGIADLAGNVEEWTDTLYVPYPNGKLIQDRLFHFGNGTYNILRGGCYSLHGDLCLSKRRHGFYPKYSITGFRIAETI